MSFFGDKLKSLREEENMTQAELSEVTGIKQSLISLLESGKRHPTRNTVDVMSNYFGVPVVKLTGTRNGEPKEVEELKRKLMEASPEIIAKVSSYVDFLIWEGKQGDKGKAVSPFFSEDDDSPVSFWGGNHE